MIQVHLWYLQTHDTILIHIIFKYMYVYLPTFYKEHFYKEHFDGQNEIVNLIHNVAVNSIHRQHTIHFMCNTAV